MEDYEAQSKRAWLIATGMSEDAADMTLREQAQFRQRRELRQYKQRTATMRRNIKNKFDIDTPAEPPVEGNKHSLWDIFDIFFALEYPIFNAVKHISEGDSAGEVLSAAAKGLILQEKTSGDELLDALGVTDGKGRSIGGFLLEIAANPANFIGGPLSLTKAGAAAADASAGMISGGMKGASKLLAKTGAATVDDALAGVTKLARGWGAQAAAPIAQRALLTAKWNPMASTGTAVIRGAPIVQKIGEAQAAWEALAPVAGVLRFFGHISDPTARRVLQYGGWRIRGGGRQAYEAGLKITKMLEAVGDDDAGRLCIQLIEDPLMATMVDIIGTDKMKTRDLARQIIQNFETQSLARMNTTKNAPEGATALKNGLLGALTDGLGIDDAERVIGALETHDPQLFGKLHKMNYFVRKTLVENRNDYLGPGFLDEFFKIIDPSEALRDEIKGVVRGGSIFDKGRMISKWMAEDHPAMKTRFKEIVDEIYVNKGAGILSPIIEARIGKNIPTGYDEIFAEGMSLFARNPAAVLAQSPEMFFFYQSMAKKSTEMGLPKIFNLNAAMIRKAAAMNQATHLEAIIKDYITVPLKSMSVGERTGTRLLALLRTQLDNHSNRTSVFNGPLKQLHALAVGDWDSLPKKWFEANGDLKSSAYVAAMIGRVNKQMRDISKAMRGDLKAVRNLRREGIFTEKIMDDLFLGWRNPRYGLERESFTVNLAPDPKTLWAPAQSLMAGMPKRPSVPTTLYRKLDNNPIPLVWASEHSTVARTIIASRIDEMSEKMLPILTGMMDESSFASKTKAFLAAKAYRNALVIQSLQGAAIPAKMGPKFKPYGTSLKEIVDAARTSDTAFQVDDRVYAAAKLMQADLNQMGEMEKSLGILRSMAEFYVPHKLTQEYIDAMNKRAMVVGKKISGKLAYAEHRKWVDTIEKLEVGQILPDGIPSKYIHDPGMLLTMRKAAHSRAVNYYNMAVELTDKFGVKLNAGEALPANLAKTHDIFEYAPLGKKLGGPGRYAVPKDIAQSINGYHTLMTNQAEVKLLGDAWHALVSHWRGWSLGIFPAYHSRNMVNNFVQNWFSGMSPNDMIWGHTLASRMQKYGSELTQEFVDTPRGRKSLAEVYEAFVDLDGISSGYAGAEFADTAKRGMAQMAKRKALQGKTPPSTQNPLRASTDFIGAAIQEAKVATTGMEKKGLREWLPSFISRNPTLKKPAFAPMPADSKIAVVGFAVGKSFEDNARLAQFLYSVRQGYTYEQARERVAKYLFDYNDINIVVDKMRDIFPFIVWSRKNIPMQLENLVMRPARLGIIGKAKDTMEDLTSAEGGMDFPDLPQFIRQNVPFAVRKLQDGTFEYFLLGNWMGFADLQRLMDPVPETINMLFPGIRVPFEMAANYSFFFRGPIAKNTPDEAKKFLGVNLDPMAVHVLQSFRVLSETNRLFGLGDAVKENNMQRTLRFAFGMRPYVVDPEQEMLRRYRDYTISLGRLSSHEQHKRDK